MTFRIRHKSTGRFVKKEGSTWFSAICIAAGLGYKDAWNQTEQKRYWIKIEPIPSELKYGLTKGVGHIYATKKGAEGFLELLPPQVLDQFEIVEEVPRNCPDCGVEHTPSCSEILKTGKPPPHVHDHYCVIYCETLGGPVG